jgi:hypothetical protein
MTKRNLLFILLFTFSLSYGQYDWRSGKVVLKNGDTLKGVLKIPMITRGLLSIPKYKLEYKKDEKGKKKKFDKTQVNKVFFGTSNSNIGYYEYAPIPNSILIKKMALVKLIRNGKVKLYTRTIKAGVNTGFQNQKKIIKRKEYFIIRENEKIATRVPQESNEVSITSKWNLKSFKNDMKKYFSDCPEIVAYIEDGIYENFDIAQIVEDYNLFCE